MLLFSVHQAHVYSELANMTPQLMAYCVAVAVFTLAYGPATRARTREGNRSYSNAR